MLRDLKRSLQTKVRKVERDDDAAHVLDFPALPQGLQDTLGSPAYETWWQNAYGEREQPLGKGFSGQHFPHTVALRKSSRLLSPAQAPSSALDCMQALCHSSQDGNPMFQMLACLAQLGQGMASANSLQQAVPLQGLQIFDDPRKKGAIAAPPTKTPAAASSPSGKDGTPTKEESESQANSPPSEKKASQSPRLLALPDVPVVSPEEQAKVMMEALQEREKAKPKPKAKGKAAAKSTAKTKATAKAKAKATAKAKAKATASADEGKVQASEQAAEDTEDQQPPAAAKGKAKAKGKAEGQGNTQVSPCASSTWAKAPNAGRTNRDYMV